MPANTYVDTYLHLWCLIKDAPATVAIRNYLQADGGPQAKSAEKAKDALLQKIPKISGYAKTKIPGVFEINGDQYLTLSIARVFIGKGAPNEIQDVIYLASLCDLVDVASLPTYADNNLGVDCGGFVATYWGMGRPTLTSPNPTGSLGFKPRYIWEINRPYRRKTVAEIQVDDAIIFFTGLLSNGPDHPAPLDANGKFDDSKGSRAHHIALVSAITPIAGTDQIKLEISESSGAPATSGGNGVNVRTDDSLKTKVEGGLVYCPVSDGRVYFVGRPNQDPPYPAEHQTP